MEGEENEINYKDLRDTTIEIVVGLGFHINILGKMYEDPRYYSEREVFGLLIQQTSEFINYYMLFFGITEEEYKEKVSQYVKENKLIFIDRNTGFENVEFG